MTSVRPKRFRCSPSTYYAHFQSWTLECSAQPQVGKIGVILRSPKFLPECMTWRTLLILNVALISIHASYFISTPPADGFLNIIFTANSLQVTTRYLLRIICRIALERSQIVHVNLLTIIADSFLANICAKTLLITNCAYFVVSHRPIGFKTNPWTKEDYNVATQAKASHTLNSARRCIRVYYERTTNSQKRPLTYACLPHSELTFN